VQQTFVNSDNTSHAISNTSLSEGKGIGENSGFTYVMSQVIQSVDIQDRHST
jgi:hypothetical protein